MTGGERRRTSGGTDRPSHRIGYLLSGYPLVSETFVLREVLALRRSGIEIEVAAINEPVGRTAPMTAEERAEADRTFYVKRQGPLGALRSHAAVLVRNRTGWGRGATTAMRFGRLDLRAQLYGFAYLSEALIVARWMRRHRLDHLHAHLGTQASTVALLVKRITGCGLSLTIHGPDEFYGAEAHHLARKVSESDFIFCISDFARSQLMKLADHQHWSKLEVVRLGVDRSAFSPPVRLRGDRWKVLCVGRLTEAKGHHILIEAIAQIVGTGRPVELHLVGDGPTRASLERLVASSGLEDAVIFHGAVNHDRIRQHYAAADAFALASFAEGIPVVLMEAMAMELPCVSTHVAGIPELITDGESGLLVPASNASALATALARLIDDPERAQRLARAGRQTVLSQYDHAVNVAKLASEFRTRLDRRPARTGAEDGRGGARQLSAAASRT